MLRCCLGLIYINYGVNTSRKNKKPFNDDQTQAQNSFLSKCLKNFKSSNKTFK